MNSIKWIQIEPNYNRIFPGTDGCRPSPQTSSHLLVYERLPPSNSPWIGSQIYYPVGTGWFGLLLVDKGRNSQPNSSTRCLGTSLQYSSLNPDFISSEGCFGTDIIQKCTKWFQIGVHGLIFWPIIAKCQCARFFMRKKVKQWQYGWTKNTKL